MPHIFNREESKINAVNKKVYRAKMMAKKQHSDLKLKHPDWCRDASKGDYTLLTKKITEECQKKQHRNQIFTEKLHETTG